MGSVVEFAEWRKQAVGPELALADEQLYLVWLAREGLKPGATITVRTKEGPVEITPDPLYIASVADKLSRVMERVVKRREGETIHVKLAQPEIERAFEAVADAVVDTIDDPELARRVGDAITEALKGIGGREA